MDTLITIDEATAKVNQVAGYEDLTGLASGNGISCYVAKSYSLNSAQDLERFVELDLDALIVIGWERLIPETVLSTLRCGAFGMHGSPRGLPLGRGRSPLNWSIICGETAFRTSLFRYLPGIDDGDVVDTIEFDINEFDTCRTLHFKNRMAMNMLLDRHLEPILEGQAEFVPQPESTPTYYPRRRPEDGAIDWTRPSSEIYDLVRALTRPYPGAFSDFAGGRLRIWRSQPFGKFLSRVGEPGTIREIFSDRSLLVETGDHPILLADVEVEGELDISIGMRLASVPWQKVVESVVTRYPSHVAPDQQEIRLDSCRAGQRL